MLADALSGSSVRAIAVADVGNNTLVAAGSFRYCNGTAREILDCSLASRVNTADIRDLGNSLQSSDGGKTWTQTQQLDSLLRSESAIVTWNVTAAIERNAGTGADLAPSRQLVAACLVGGVRLQLNNGTRTGLLVVPTVSVLCYTKSQDGSTGEWAEQAPLPMALSHSAAVYWEGNVLTFGGRISLTGGAVGGTPGELRSLRIVGRASICRHIL